MIISPFNCRLIDCVKVARPGFYDLGHSAIHLVVRIHLRFILLFVYRRLPVTLITEGTVTFNGPLIFYSLNLNDAIRIGQVGT